MKKNGVGGANTKTGLTFELKTDLPTFISKQKNYKVVDNDKTKKGKIRKTNKRWKVFYKNEEIAEIFQQHGLYRYFDEIKYDYTKVVSKKLLPDESILVKKTNTIYIIEKKTQSTRGSVDEKLQTCHFKLRQYKKLFKNHNIKVKYVYLLDNWFEKKEYEDVLKYIKYVKCKYYFNKIPLTDLDLPISE